MHFLLLILLWPCFVSAQTNIGGLQVLAAPDLEVQEQAINISPDQVKIATRYFNDSSNDINQTLVFALPVKGEENATQYLVTVNQQPVQYKVMQRAISSNGRDVSQQLKTLGLTFNPIAAMQHIDASTNRTSIISKLHSLHLLDRLEETPNWSVQTYYYWQQIFPAKSAVIIEQSYKPKTITKTAKLNNWATIFKLPINVVKKMVHMAVTWKLEDNLAAENLRAQLEKSNPQIVEFCPTSADYQALVKSYKKQPDRKPQIEMKNVNYVCNTDQTWAKPINHFSLTIQAPNNMHPLLCWNDELKQSKAGLQFSSEDYVPLQNIRVLYIEK